MCGMLCVVLSSGNPSKNVWYAMCSLVLTMCSVAGDHKGSVAVTDVHDNRVIVNCSAPDQPGYLVKPVSLKCPIDENKLLKNKLLK